LVELSGPAIKLVLRNVPEPVTATAKKLAATRGEEKLACVPIALRTLETPEYSLEPGQAGKESNFLTDVLPGWRGTLQPHRAEPHPVKCPVLLPEREGVLAIHEIST
jgi:hypothetical protein